MQIGKQTARRGLYDPRFEHDACVQWALKDIPATAVIFH